MEDVNTTLFTDEAFATEFRTFSVPFNAGSISSAWKKETQIYIYKILHPIYISFNLIPIIPSLLNPHSVQYELYII